MIVATFLVRLGVRDEKRHFIRYTKTIESYDLAVAAFGSQSIQYNRKPKNENSDIDRMMLSSLALFSVCHWL